jgi:hypothetical protein
MKFGSSLTEESVIVISTLARIAHPAQIHPQEQPSRTVTPDSLPSSYDRSVFANLGLFLETFMTSKKTHNLVSSGSKQKRDSNKYRVSD